MSRKVSGFELALAVGVVMLGGFVGSMIVSSRQDAPPAVVGLSAADSFHVATQYQNQLAARGGVYVQPEWLTTLHVAQLQRVAALERSEGADAATALPPDSIDAILSGSGGSYFNAMLAEDSGVVSRWQSSDEPIGVWVQPYSSERGFTPDYVAPAKRGFSAWNELGLGARFAIVEDSSLARVHVTWSAVMSRPEQVGATFRITNRGGWIVLAHVILSTARNIYTVQNAVRHEAGHVLGLGHSPNVEDIMAGATAGRQYKLTDADARTAALLYRLPAGVIPRETWRR